MIAAEQAIRRAGMDKNDPILQPYTAKTKPALVEVPAGWFIRINGQGDPNDEAFALATSALFSLSYAVRMSYKSDHVPVGYQTYKVFPLEGEWGLVDPALAATNRDNWAYSLMIRQPPFLGMADHQRIAAEVARKKPNPLISAARFELVEEGLCCQALHIGPYSQEPATFALMDAFIKQQGFCRAGHNHREIYLGDPRKAAPASLRTILRVKVVATR